MKFSFSLITCLLLLSSPLFAADSTPKDDVIAAAKKLAAADNYSWTTTVAVPSGSRFRPGPTDGKTEKDGYTYFSSVRNDTTNHAALKGGKGAMQVEGEWQSLTDAAKDNGDGGFNMVRMYARILQNFKTPAVEAEYLAGKTGELKSADGVISGDLTEAGAKEKLTLGPVNGDNGPTVTDAKGSIKYWLTDGSLTKYEYHVSGTIDFNGNSRDVDRTTTVVVKDVGTTKVEVPEEAKSKIN